MGRSPGSGLRCIVGRQGHLVRSVLYRLWNIMYVWVLVAGEEVFPRYLPWRPLKSSGQCLPSLHPTWELAVHSLVGIFSVFVNCALILSTPGRTYPSRQVFPKIHLNFSQPGILSSFKNFRYVLYFLKVHNWLRCLGRTLSLVNWAHKDLLPVTTGEQTVHRQHAACYHRPLEALKTAWLSRGPHPQTQVHMYIRTHLYLI